MFSMRQFIPEEFLKESCIEFALNEISSFALNLGYDKYVDSDLKKLWKGLCHDESINYKTQVVLEDKLHNLSNFNNFSIVTLQDEIKQHLFLNSCMIEIYNGYLGGEDFSGNITKSLSRIRKKENITAQNFNFLRKYKKYSFLFPFDLIVRESSDVPDSIPMYFDDFLSYVLVNMSKADASPVHLYKYNEITMENEDDVLNNINTFLEFCKKYYIYSDEFSFSIFSNYLFEQDYNHSLALSIMHSIDYISKLRDITDEDKNLIRITLSFISLLPVYSKRNFMQLIIKLGFESERYGAYYAGGETKPFSREWSEFCIKNILKLSFIIVPVMEQIYYYLIRNNPFQSSLEKSLFIAQNESWYIDLINRNNQSIVESNKVMQLNSNPVEKTKEVGDYYQIQKIISTLKTAFSKNVMSTIYSSCIKTCNEATVQLKIEDAFFTESYLNLDFDSILKYIENILNGNMKNVVTIGVNRTQPEKTYFEKQLKASLELKELLYGQFDRLFHF